MGRKVTIADVMHELFRNNERLVEEMTPEDILPFVEQSLINRAAKCVPLSSLNLLLINLPLRAGMLPS